MAKHSIALEEKFRESARESEKTQRQLKVASSAVLEIQYFTLGKAEKGWLRRQQLEGMKEQLELSFGRTVIVDAASVKATARFQGVYARLQIHFHINRLRTARGKSVLKGLHKKVSAVTAKVGDLESGNILL